MIKFAKDTVGRTIHSIKNFKTNPLDSMGQLIPVVIVLINFIVFIVAYINFIISGTYMTQTDLIINRGRLKEAFSWGTLYYFIEKMNLIIAGVLTFVDYVIMMIVFGKREIKWKRIFVLADMAVMGISLVLIPITNKSSSSIFRILFGIALVVFIILVMYLENKCFVRDWAVALGIAYVVLPALLLFLENVVPVVAVAVMILLGALIIALALGAIVLGIKIMFWFGKLIDIFFDGSGGSSGASYSNRWEDTDKGDTKKSTERRNDCVYITDYNRVGGIKLYKVKGTMNDYVELDNGLVTREICSLQMLRNGKFHIYDEKTKREIKENEIPWR